MKKILVADDDPAICDALQFMLEDEGYNVYTTSNGNTIEKCNVEIPDLLLLDIWMSGEDGREVCKAIKINEQTTQLPVILISASPDLARSAKEAGANAFVAKPFKMDQLISVVKKYI